MLFSAVFSLKFTRSFFG